MIDCIREWKLLGEYLKNKMLLPLHACWKKISQKGIVRTSTVNMFYIFKFQSFTIVTSWSHVVSCFCITSTFVLFLTTTPYFNCKFPLIPQESGVKKYEQKTEQSSVKFNLVTDKNLLFYTYYDFFSSTFYFKSNRRFNKHFLQSCNINMYS